MITESEYVARANAELSALMRALDALEADELDCELENDILTLQVGDEPEYVINSHRAARQIWMAAEHMAWHFDWEQSRCLWIAKKNGEELWSTVRRCLAPHLRPIDLEQHFVRPKGELI